MDVEAMVWLGVMIVLVVIELATMGLTTIWFAGGAAAAFVSALLGANVILQAAVFLVVSVLLLIFTRPFAARYINRGHVSTNVEAIPGKTAVVIEEISNLKGTGRVRLDGNEWMARTEDENQVIAKEKLVYVLRVSGAKLIVTGKE